MRLFIGIQFSKAILDELLKIQNEIRGKAKRGRFVRGENLHLTLQFLGEITAQEIEPIVDALRSTAEGHSEFILAAKRIGSFRNGQIHRVVWVGVGGDLQKLINVQKDISLSLSRLGIQPENRPYKPHITLGRDVELINEGTFEPYSETILKEPFPVSGFSLIESKMEHGNLTYRTLYTFALKR